MKCMYCPLNSLIFSMLPRFLRLRLEGAEEVGLGVLEKLGKIERIRTGIKTETGIKGNLR